MSTSTPRILFMGMNGDFSRLPLQALLEAGHHVAALVIPSPVAERAAPRSLHPPVTVPPPGPIPLTPTSPSLLQLAAARQLPIFEVSSLTHPAARELLHTLHPDLVCVACFPRLLPPAWLHYPPLGCLNLHPSLLPAYRGPAPLFWQFRNGETHFGVTLHFMDETADTGDIVAQKRVPLPEGILGPEAERRTATAGAHLLLQALANPHHIPRTPQPSRGASYHPWPSPADRVISTTWPARRAFNFIRGASQWAPFEIHTGETSLWVSEALDYQPLSHLQHPYQHQGDEIHIQFSPGVLRAR